MLGMSIMWGQWTKDTPSMVVLVRVYGTSLPKEGPMHILLLPDMFELVISY